MTRAELLQKAKPILFNTDMVRAILDGRKTETRRVLKPQPMFYTGRRYIFADDVCPKKWEDCYNIIETYKYQPGDYLYVRETWQYCYELDGNDQIIEDTGKYVYAASPEDMPKFTEWVRDDGTHTYAMPWRPSIHMPKEAARIFLRVTDVLVERLQDISEDGVVAEGAEPFIQCPREHVIIEPDGTKGDMCWNTDCCKQCDYISKSYGELFGEIVWDSTLKKSDIDRYGWNANPWVWVIEFERVETD